MSTVVKKRSPNFTEVEKQTLLAIANRYSSILESKKTEFSENKKKEAWVAVAKEYNASATSGTRDWRQLKHMYVNYKQVLRKQVASENRSRYIEKLEKAGVTEAEAVEAKRLVADEKREVQKTGGGVFRSSVDGQCEQVVAIITEQAKPLSNPFDDAADYFDDEMPIIELPAAPSPVHPVEPLPSTSTASAVTKRRKQAKRLPNSETLRKIYFKKKFKTRTWKVLC